MPTLPPRACRRARLVLRMGSGGVGTILIAGLFAGLITGLITGLIAGLTFSAASASAAEAGQGGPTMRLTAPDWDHDLVLSTPAGYVQLRWNPPADAPDRDSVDWVYQLQEGRRAEFSDGDRHYEGHHTSSFVSGLENGDFYFRVRARRPDEDLWSAWSQTLHVEVTHHSHVLALSLMGLGAAVFIATAAFLLAHRNDPIEAPATAAATASAAAISGGEAGDRR